MNFSLGSICQSFLVILTQKQFFIQWSGLLQTFCCNTFLGIIIIDYDFLVMLTYALFYSNEPTKQKSFTNARPIYQFQEPCVCLTVFFGRDGNLPLHRQIYYWTDQKQQRFLL